MSDTFFTSADGEWFSPTDATRGPWDVDACHAGPPTGLLARASEREIPDRQLVRLTAELLRPIPHAGFAVTAEVTRRGRSISTTRLAIVEGSGREVVTATAMHLATASFGDLPTATTPTPSVAEARPDVFPMRRTLHGRPAFTTSVEAMYPPGEDPEPGPTRMWMRALPLLPGEEPSPFQRICPLSDCGNAISRNGEPEDFAFLNVDLTISLHRPPAGDWLGSDSVSRWEPNGIGLSDSLLFDERGPVGRALQTLLVRPQRAPS